MAARGVLNRIKTMVERRNPVVVYLYRAAQDGIHYRRMRSVNTPDGFRFAGDEAMQTGAFEPNEMQTIKRQLEKMALRPSSSDTIHREACACYPGIKLYGGSSY